MSLFWRVLVLVALATGGALAWHALAQDPGYVLVTLRGYSVESSLVVAIAGVLVAWLLLRVLVWLLMLPFRAWRRRSHRIAQERLADGLVALYEGRWARAEKLLARAASDPTLRLPALMAALRASEARGDTERAAQLRASIDARGEPAALAIHDAERALSDGDGEAAQRALERLGENAPPRAIELRIRSLIALGRAHEAQLLLPALRHSQLLAGAALEAFEAEVISAAMLQSRDADTLRARWSELGRGARSRAEVAGAYALRAAALGLEEDAADAVEHALRKQWDERLARLYGQIPRGRRASPLKAAEKWLQSQPNSPALLLSLGRLCREESLWGKAEDYLHRALAQGAGAEAWEELGHAYAAQRDETRARQAFANALRVHRGDAPQPIPGRGLRQLIQDEAVAEERTPMGVPRLPGVDTL